MFNFKELPSLSLYIHIPWCIKKCPYCDFNSHELKDAIPEQDYINALLADLEQDLPLVWGRRLQSIFIGGGTPSLLSTAAYSRLFSELRARIPFVHDMEITLEANPGAVDSQRFTDYREAGINRLSMGIQSLNNPHLQQLGRIHDNSQALSAFAQARKAGFDNINLDMMFGLPQQDLQQARQDLEQLIQLQPEHISYYQLTIEPNTYFHHHPPQCGDDELLAEMQAQGIALLEAAGYRRYEISAYARAGHRCRHNLNYWQFGDYLGIGAGAQGKISRADTQSIVRLGKHRNPRDYFNRWHGDQGFVSSRQNLTENDVLLEFALNSLRMIEGFTIQQFVSHTGLPEHLIRPRIDQAIAKGLAIEDKDHIRASETGLLFLNDLVTLFLD